MILKARLSKPVVAWLHANPGRVEPFAEALWKVRCGTDLGEPITNPGSRYLLRLFRFGDTPRCLALFQLDSAARLIRVTSCRSLPNEPRDRPSI